MQPNGTPLSVRFFIFPSLYLALSNRLKFHHLALSFGKCPRFILPDNFSCLLWVGLYACHGLVSRHFRANLYFVRIRRQTCVRFNPFFTLFIKKMKPIRGFATQSDRSLCKLRCTRFQFRWVAQFEIDFLLTEFTDLWNTCGFCTHCSTYNSRQLIKIRLFSKPYLARLQKLNIGLFHCQGDEFGSFDRKSITLLGNNSIAPQ